VDTVRTTLAACRVPWPEVEHDERGMAITNPEREREGQ